MAFFRAVMTTSVPFPSYSTMENAVSVTDLICGWPPGAQSSQLTARSRRYRRCKEKWLISPKKISPKAAGKPSRFQMQFR